MHRFLKAVKTEMILCKKGNNFHLLLFCLSALLFKVKKALLKVLFEFIAMDEAVV